METNFEKLKDFFKEKEDVRMAFLFGSEAAGRPIAESDVDVAVWFGTKYSIEDISRLQGEIEDLLHRPVDLVVLNQANPTIAWAAMRGKQLIIRDYRLFIAKLLEISTEAEDIQDFVIDLFKLREKARAMNA